MAMPRGKRSNTPTKVAAAQAAAVEELRKQLALMPAVVEDLELLVAPKTKRVPLNSSWPAIPFAILALYAEATNTTYNKVLQALVMQYLPVEIVAKPSTRRMRKGLSEAVEQG